ncbi:hypothetical protein GCM10007061_07780 [Kocuria marina]|nr:hypothetical protein GCM10007061_07780 [Kocuria marina]
MGYPQEKRPEDHGSHPVAHGVHAQPRPTAGRPRGPALFACAHEDSCDPGEKGAPRVCGAGDTHEDSGVGRTGRTCIVTGEVRIPACP